MKKSNHSIVMFMFALALFLLGGVAVADVEDNLTYQGNKARITVGKIKDKADGCSWQEAAAVVARTRPRIPLRPTTPWKRRRPYRPKPMTRKRARSPHPTNAWSK